MTEARPIQARQGAERAEGRSLELPQFKGRPGWEFTDISELDLAAYEPVTGPEPEGARPADVLFGVDSAPSLPDGVVVVPIGDAVRTHQELLSRHLSTVVSADDVL